MKTKYKIIQYIPLTKPQVINLKGEVKSFKILTTEKCWLQNNDK